MNPEKITRNLDKDILLRVISLCRMTLERGINPFEVEIKEALESIRPHLEKYKNFEELLLDAEAVNQISRIVKLQGDWLKYRSSNLYADPLLIELKLRGLPIEDLAQIFLKAWHPIVAVTQLLKERVSQAVAYWNKLEPFDQRQWASSLTGEGSSSEVSWKELREMGLIAGQAFSQALTKLTAELKVKATEKGVVDYWDFVFAETYEETVSRIWLTSFLVSYGYASMEIKPLEETITLKPLEGDGKTPPSGNLGRSLVVAMSHEQWRSWKGRNQ